MSGDAFDAAYGIAQLCGRNRHVRVSVGPVISQKDVDVSNAPLQLLSISGVRNARTLRSRFSAQFLQMFFQIAQKARYLLGLMARNGEDIGELFQLLDLYL